LVENIFVVLIVSQACDTIVVCELLSLFSTLLYVKSVFLYKSLNFFNFIYLLLKGIIAFLNQAEKFKFELILRGKIFHAHIS